MLSDLVKVFLLIASEVDAVFERHRSLLRSRDEDFLSLRSSNPISKLENVWNRSRQQNQTNVRGKHDDDLFPHDTSLGVIYVVHLVKDDPFDVTYQIRASIQHTPQNFRRHDETSRFWLDGNVTCQQTDVEHLPKISKLLVANRLDWRRIDGARAVFRSQRKGVFCNHGLARGSVRSNEHIF